MFRNIGYADQLGSGVRKLFKYSKYYSGKDPQFVEGKGQITSRQVEELLKVKQRRARSILGELVNMGLLERQA